MTTSEARSMSALAQVSVRTAPKANPNLAAALSRLKPEPEELLTRRQVARRCQTCTHTIMRWERRGLIKSIRINARVLRYRRSEVERLLQHAAS